MAIGKEQASRLRALKIKRATKERVAIRKEMLRNLKAELEAKIDAAITDQVGSCATLRLDIDTPKTTINSLIKKYEELGWHATIEKIGTYHGYDYVEPQHFRLTLE